jgi:hypothetical protein
VACHDSREASINDPAGTGRMSAQARPRYKGDLAVFILIALSVGLMLVVDNRTAVLTKRAAYYFQSYDFLSLISGSSGHADQTMGASAYIQWLRESPVAVAFGVGPGNAAFHAFEHCSLGEGGESATGIILSSRFPLIDMLGSIGLVGIFLLVLFGRYCWKTSTASLRFFPEATVSHILFLHGVLLFLILYLLTFDCTLLTWLTLGILHRLSDYTNLP